MRSQLSRGGTPLGGPCGPGLTERDVLERNEDKVRIRVGLFAEWLVRNQ